MVAMRPEMVTSMPSTTTLRPWTDTDRPASVAEMELNKAAGMPTDPAALLSCNLTLPQRL